MCHAVTASPRVECRPDVYAHEQKGTSATKLPKTTITPDVKLIPAIIPVQVCQIMMGNIYDIDSSQAVTW